MARTGAEPLRVLLTGAAVLLLAACGSAPDSVGTEAAPSPSQTPSTTPPQALFVLDCEPGENSVSGDAYALPSSMEHFPTAEGLAGRVLAAHPDWGTARDGNQGDINLAVYDEAGDIKQIIIASKDADGWFSTSERHCETADLYR